MTIHRARIQNVDVLTRSLSPSSDPLPKVLFLQKAREVTSFLLQEAFPDLQAHSSVDAAIQGSTSHALSKRMVTGSKFRIHREHNKEREG